MHSQVTQVGHNTLASSAILAVIKTQKSAVSSSSNFKCLLSKANAEAATKKNPAQLRDSASNLSFIIINAFVATQQLALATR